MSGLPVLTTSASLPSDVDVVIVGLVDAGGRTTLAGADALMSTFAKKAGAPLDAVAASLGARPKPGSAVAVPGAGQTLIVVGLGDADVTPGRVRTAVAAGVRKALEVAVDKVIRVAVSLDLAEPEILDAAAQAAALTSYRYDKPGSPAPTASISGIAMIASTKLSGVVGDAAVKAENVALARDWVNTPANVLYPESWVEFAREAFKGLKVTIEVLDEKALAKGGFGGIINVGQGSARPPRLFKATYAPRGAKTHLALIGKGMTFDTGGLNLKPADGMYDMKCDMGGGAATLAALRAIVQLGLKIKVSAFVSMAENMPSGSAYRPSDVLTMYSGKTVENANSDAEGRLVMADALALAGEGKPDFMVDIATLTGACMVALGKRQAGLMANMDAAADRVLDAAESAGEAVWHLPITDEVVEGLKSDVADLKSSGARHGGALTAAAFLREFVPEGTPWAHLDIAGPAWTDAAHDEVTKGGTGFGVRTLVALAAQMAG